MEQFCKSILMFVLFGTTIAKKTGAPILHTYHTLYEQYSDYVLSGKKVLSNHLIRKLSKWRLRHTASVIVPSHKTENVLKNYGIDKPIYVVPTGISLEQHQQRIASDTRKMLRSKYGISDDAFVLISLGRLAAEKSIDELLICFSWIYEENPDLILLIVGDGPERSTLEDWVNHLGIGSKVIFTGMVNPAEIQNFYQLGDVFVSASTSETQGLTYVEAAANGLPLVCKKDPCLQGILTDRVNGFEYETLEEFEHQIFVLKTDKEFRYSASKHSEEIASSFDKCYFAESIEHIYQNIDKRNNKNGGTLHE